MEIQNENNGSIIVEAANEASNLDVALSTPPELINVRIAKHLARSRSPSGQISSKRLKTITEICERTEKNQVACSEFMHALWGEIRGSGTQRGDMLRDELMLYLRHIHDSSGRVESKQVEIGERLVGCTRECKEQADFLKEQVHTLGSEILSLKIAVNRLNALLKKMSRMLESNVHA